MLQLEIPEREYFDEESFTFTKYKKEIIQLEHSLVSLSKWESIWHKPFLSQEPKTQEELTDYIRCMTITQNVKPEIYINLPKTIFDAVQKYIDDSMTATWFTEPPNSSRNKEVITAEIIYYWMVAQTIPFDPCQKWHLNRLFTLIRVCSIKNQPPKKMNKKEAMSKRSALNQARRAKGQSRG